MSKPKLRVLVLDDDPSLLEMMRLTLVKQGFEVAAGASARQARELLEQAEYAAVVSDIYLGDASAIELLDEMRQHSPDAAIILVTAQGTVETAAAASAAGVFDYLAKPFSLEQLVERVRAGVDAHPEQSAPPAGGPASMIIGAHPSIVEVYKAVARVARLPVPVLLHGETGTGKELVARALHRFGASPDGPFVAINCGAIPETLLESELFGHRRGAFTGADRDHRGAVEAARDGTLFLDEVGELSPTLQVKLLRFLQEGEIQPVGAVAPVTVATRVVAATHRQLRREAEAGRFREDFYYRLAVYEIHIPSLRERSSDIPRLVEHFTGQVQERLERSAVPGPSPQTLALLAAHDWPGNVRELEHLVQRAVIDLGSLADVEGIRSLLEASTRKPEHDEPAIGDELTLEEVERLHIAAVLQRCQGNKSQAAAILGVDRKSLYRKLQRLGIETD